MADVDRPAEARASLESLEAGPTLVVQGHDFAVQDQSVERQGGDRAQDLGEAGRAVIAVAGEQPRLAFDARGEDAVAVELGLE